MICFVPLIASAKLTSIDGLVSKLSGRLQQAALSNASEYTKMVFVGVNYDCLEAFSFTEISISSRLLSAINWCLINLLEVILNVSVLKPT